uniref:Ubiquitin-associated-domain-containing protein n=1 Tax=uncultured bacterium Contig575 TaxID=1393592 RepID=W0FNK7_9BACT|nr:ubiquitin-associated- domain-containing protein [uncultured bacterium Contig575]
MAPSKAKEIRTMTEINAGNAVMTENEPTEEMTNRTRTGAARHEMTEQLSGKMHITLERARAVLEDADWNMLTATHLLEQEDFLRKQELNEAAAVEIPAEEPLAGQAISEDRAAEKAAEKTGMRGSGLKKAGRTLMNLIALGNRSHFAIHRGGEQLLEMPVTVLALLLLFSFGTCAFLMVVGLFAGCRYSIDGLSAAET